MRAGTRSSTSTPRRNLPSSPPGLRPTAPAISPRSRPCASPMSQAAFVAARAAAPALKATRGRVVTISSGAGLRPSLTRLHPYCAAKHALVGLTKQLALELGPFGVGRRRAATLGEQTYAW